MSPAEIEYRLARSLDDYMARRVRGEDPRAEDYRDEVGEASWPEFQQMVELEEMLDQVLDPGPEEPLPREFGPYTLIRELGRGANGIVYEAVHRELKRREAVKVLRDGLEGEGTVYDRFRNEAKHLARVRHDHIVEIYGAGKVDGRPYYAMTLLEGTTLSQLARRGELPPHEELCRGLAGVADALHTLHTQDKPTIHRDVKPSNILVTKDGRMMLADFGLARSLEDERLTRTGQALGSPLYMSPEQLLAKRGEIDARTDVYELGATLYELLAGRPLFPTDDIRALMQSILGERPESLRKVAPEVPGRCADIAMKALEKRRRDRYPDAAAMRDDLLAFADGQRVRGRPVSSMRHRLRSIRRHALPIAAALLAVLAAGLWWFNRPGAIDVMGFAGVRIVVDGEARGEIPSKVEVASGRHVVVLQHPEFEDQEVPVTVPAGTVVPLPYYTPQARNADSPAAMQAIAETAEIDLAVLGIGSTHRGRARNATVAVAVLPGGRVRLEGLGPLYLETAMSVDPVVARLVFRRERDGVTETIYDEPLGEQPNLRVQESVPEAVLAALQVGDRVTWGLETEAGPTLSQTFTVVAGDEALDARLARLDEVAQNQTEALRAGLRANVLLGAGLPAEAYAVASKVTDFADPTRPLVVETVEGRGLAWLVMRAALDRVSDTTTHQLGATVANVARQLPEDLRKALATPAAGD